MLLSSLTENLGELTIKHSVTLTIEIDQKFCDVLGESPQSIVAEALITGMNKLVNRYKEQVTGSLLRSKIERSNSKLN